MAIYYVDYTTGDDGDSGLTEALAWKTIAKVNGETFAGDDQVLFKHGETWREQLIVPDSGAASHPITFGAYGTGDLPKIYGSTAIATWTDEGGNIWYATLATDLSSVWFIAPTTGTVTHGTEEALKASLSAEYEWWWDDPNDRLYVYAASDPDSRYASVEAQSLADVIRSGDETFITVEDLEIAFCSENLIEISTASINWTIDGCTIHHAGNPADALSNGIRCAASGSLIQNNIVHDCGRHGIYLTVQTGETVSSGIVQNNIVYDCYHTGIDVMNQHALGAISGISILRNRVYTTANYANFAASCNGIWLQGNVANAFVDSVTIAYNVVYNMAGYSIGLSDRAKNSTLYNNTMFGVNPEYLGTGDAGVGGGLFMSATGTSGITIKNNIACGPFFDTTCYAAALRPTSIAACDYNCWWHDGGKVVYDGTTSYHYDDFTAYKTATGFDAHGLWEDPKFVDVATYDFHLQATSPCINAGVDVGLTEDFEGNPLV